MLDKRSLMNKKTPITSEIVLIPTEVEVEVNDKRAINSSNKTDLILKSSKAKSDSLEKSSSS